MADARLNIVISALNTAKGELDSLKKDLGEVETTTKKTSAGFMDMALGIGKATVTMAGFGIAAKKIFDLGQAGASLAQARESFQGLGIDLADLQDASGGTIDDLTLMTSAAKLLAGTTGTLSDEMAAATPRLIEIARAAVKLDPTIGSVAQVFQSLATGIKKNQPLLIDNSNIAVKVGTANEAMARSLGKSVNELTDAEKATALLNETLRAGDELIQQVGGNVDSLVDPYSRMTTQVKNMAAGFKEELAPAITAVVGPMGDQMALMNDMEDLLGKQAVSQAHLNQQVTAGRQNLEDLKDTYIRVKSAAEGYAARVDIEAQAHANAAGPIYDSADAVEQYNLAISGADAAALEALAANTQLAADAAANAQIAFMNAAASLDEMSVASYVSAQLSVLNAAVDAGTLSAEAYAAANEALLVKFGLLTPAEESAQGSLDRLNAAYAGGKISAEAYAIAVANIRSQIDGLQSKTVDININTHHSDYYNMPQKGDAPQHMASGGMSPGGLSWVGERGPELVRLPRGAQVYDAQQSQNIANNYSITVNTAATSGTYMQDIALAQAMAQ